MAKNNSNKAVAWNKIAGFMAFFALIIKGIDGILATFGGNLGIFTSIADIFLIVSVIIAGWRFLRSTTLPGKKLYWTIAFWVFAILALLSPTMSLFK